MGLHEAIKKFTDGVLDITNLEVTTYTGKLEQVIDETTGQIKWDEFKPSNGSLLLVAATVVKANGNTVNFQANELDQGDLKPLLDLHFAAVESARNGRTALIKIFTQSIPKVPV